MASEWKSNHLRAPGATLLLKESIHFEGLVTFTGRLSVQGLAKLTSACVHVEGGCTVAAGAELRVANCSNWFGCGGGLYVGGASVQPLEPWRRT